MQVLLLLLSLLPLVSRSSQTRCGVTFGLNCSDPAAPCCSQYSYCGDTQAYCGTNSCQPDYSIPGACSTNTSSAPPPVTPSPPGPSTKQGRCGIDPNNRSINYGRCEFSAYCCSPFAYCGVDQAHCVGCQKDFGYCPTVCNPSKPCGTLGYSTLIIAVVASLVAIAALAFECCKHFGASKGG
jgi:hypothetical protein